MPSPELNDLVDAARAGGSDDIESLLRAVWPDAYRLARAIVGEDGPAEDVAQEACIIVYRTIASLRDGAAFRTWFYRIVVREAAAIKQRRSRVEAAIEIHVNLADPAASVDIWRALSLLPHKLREVVVLRYFEDLASREIAAVLGIPDGTVRFRLMIARQRLRPLLGESTEHISRPSDEVRTNAV
jgi:RNA polymerase sigma-70 factor (ECF subfamily)